MPPIKPGERFGQLTTLFKISAASDAHYRTRWHCRCECGKESIVDSSKLRSRQTTSCGCRKGLFPNGGTVGDQTRTHGMSKTRIYGTWCKMIDRCSNPKNKSFFRYGERGITVCNRWMKFENFYADMGLPPQGKTIDRIDNNGPYSKENCHWATGSQQARNRRNTVFLTHNGQTKKLADWADELGIPRYLIHLRRQRGWSVERMLSL
jgi:hypothetical protein